MKWKRQICIWFGIAVGSQLIKMINFAASNLSDMSNKGKRNLFLTLLILEGVIYFCLAAFKSRYDLEVKWWIFSIAAIIFAFLFGAYRNFRQAVKEDEKYGPLNEKYGNKER